MKRVEEDPPLHVRAMRAVGNYERGITLEWLLAQNWEDENALMDMLSKLSVGGQIWYDHDTGMYHLTEKGKKAIRWA